MGSIGKGTNTTSTLTAGQSYIKDNFITEVGYEEAVKDSLKDLDKRFGSNNKMPVELVLDEPIYPKNAELYDDFTGDSDFYEDEYLSYLVKRSNGKFEFDSDGNIIRHKK